MEQGIHCVVSGRVQGVCYRMSTKRKAEELGLTGWVRNLPDGRVELMTYGDEAQLQKLNEWLSIGPSMAKVTSVECKVIEFEKFEDFSIR